MCKSCLLWGAFPVACNGQHPSFPTSNPKVSPVEPHCQPCLMSPPHCVPGSEASGCPRLTLHLLPAGCGWQPTPGASAGTASSVEPGRGLFSLPPTWCLPLGCSALPVFSYILFFLQTAACSPRTQRPPNPAPTPAMPLLHLTLRGPVSGVLSTYCRTLSSVTAGSIPEFAHPAFATGLGPYFILRRIKLIVCK